LDFNSFELSSAAPLSRAIEDYAMNNRRGQEPSNSHKQSTADSPRQVLAMTAAAAVLDAFYLQGRVMAEDEYAPYRDVMLSSQRLATHTVAERRREQTALILPMRRRADETVQVEFARSSNDAQALMPSGVNLCGRRSRITGIAKVSKLAGF
jgi:hypothetical protein